MARIEIDGPGTLRFAVELADDEALRQLAVGIAKNFHKEGGTWLTFAASPDMPAHNRWLPASSSVALFFDAPPPTGDGVRLTVVQ